MSKWVVDASAILAFLNREIGQERVREVLSEGAVISTIEKNILLFWRSI